MVLCFARISLFFFGGENKGSILLCILPFCFCDLIGDCMLKFFWYGICSLDRLSYFSRNIIATINHIDNDVVAHVLAVDIDESTTTHVGHTGTAKDSVDVTGTYGHICIARHITSIAATIDITANRNLRYAK